MINSDRDVINQEGYMLLGTWSSFALYVIIPSVLISYSNYRGLRTENNSCMSRRANIKFQSLRRYVDMLGIYLLEPLF